MLFRVFITTNIFLTLILKMTVTNGEDDQWSFYASRSNNRAAISRATSAMSRANDILESTLKMSGLATSMVGGQVAGLGPLIRGGIQLPKIFEVSNMTRIAFIEHRCDPCGDIEVLCKTSLNPIRDKYSQTAEVLSQANYCWTFIVLLSSWNPPKTNFHNARAQIGNLIMAWLLLSTFITDASALKEQNFEPTRSRMVKDTDPQVLGLALSVAGTVSKIMSGQITNNQGVAALFTMGSDLSQLLGMSSRKKIILIEHRCDSCGMIFVKCYNQKRARFFDSTKSYGDEFELEFSDSAIQSFEDNVMSRHGNNWGCEIRKANGQGYLDQPVYWDAPKGKKENQNVYVINDQGVHRINTRDGSQDRFHGSSWSSRPPRG